MHPFQTLVYFHDKMDESKLSVKDGEKLAKPSGQVFLQGCTLERVSDLDAGDLDDSYSPTSLSSSPKSSPSKNSKRHKYHFEIVHPDPRQSIELRAASEEELAHWMDALGVLRGSI